MMKPETKHYRTKFLETFSQQNHYRATRLGVFERNRDALTDYWLEDGLPLEDVSAETQGDNGPTVAIMLGATKPDAEHFTHRVQNVRFIKMILSVNGDSDGLEIEDEGGTTTVLRFENFE